jgi:hypothetical protein
MKSMAENWVTIGACDNKFTWVLGKLIGISIFCHWLATFFYELSSLHEEWTSYYACPRIYLKKEVDCPKEPTIKETIVEAIFF